MSFEAGKNVVEIYAFQGNGRLRNWGEPLILTGHVGLSLDGKRIYGFGPIIPKNINLREARNQLKKSAFAGQLSDDTNLFEKVAGGFYNQGQIELDLYKLTVPINEQT
jgi:hypothetical protein